MNDPMNTFVQLSSLFTGFNVDVIAPTIDETDLKQTFFDLAQRRTGPAFEALLEIYADMSGGKPVSEMGEEEKVHIGNAILESTHPEVAATAQAINKMWYLGSWYQPFEFDGHAQDLTGGFVISSDAYIKGLAWQVMQSHAMGYSTFTYGYWNSPPPSLDNFTGNPLPQGTPASRGDEA